MNASHDHSSLLERLTSDPEKNIHIIVKYAAEAIQTPCCLYNRYDQDKHIIFTPACIGLPPDFGGALRPEGSICYEKTLNSEGCIVAIEDLSATSYVKRDPIIKQNGFRSYLGCSVTIGGKVWGSLCVLDTKKRKFDQIHVRTITGLSKALSLEEERNQYRNALRQRLEWEKMLVDISTIAISIEGEKSFIDGCIERMQKTIDVEGIFIWKHNPVADTVSVLSEWIIEGHISQKDELQDIPTSMFPWGMGLMRQNKLMEYEDIEEVPEGHEKQIMRAMGVKSILMIPLFVNEEFYGTFGFEVYSHHRKWLDEDIYILRTVSQIITKAIEHHIAEKSLEEANQELEQRVKERTKELEGKQKELEKMNKMLMETNRALSALASYMERNKKETERHVARSINNRLMPIVKRLSKERLASRQRADVDLLASQLGELARGLEKAKDIPSMLSPAEARIAAMIKNGLSARDIARQLSISVETVKTHRRNIRKKLGLQNKDISLATYLHTKWEG